MVFIIYAVLREVIRKADIIRIIKSHISRETFESVLQRTTFPYCNI